MNNEQDKELINTEIQTLESMNNMLKQDTQNVVVARIDTPTEAVEKKLSDFVADAFKATDKDFAFNEQLKAELSRRMPNMTDNQFIALFSNYNVNLNDRVSKIIAPTFGMMQTKQQAEIAAAKQATQQKNVGDLGTGGGVLNPNSALDENTKPEDVRDIIEGGNILSQLFSAIGQSQRDKIPNPNETSTEESTNTQQ